MVLDEATSALDYQIEDEILKNLKQKTDGQTIIMITHNLEALKHCNKIVHLSSGRIKDINEQFI